MTFQANAKKSSNLSETQLDEFGQNNIMFYDPGECVDGGSGGSGISTICGSTPREKYWSALVQEFDDIHAAAIFGSIDHEGGGGVARWEVGVIVTDDGGTFIQPWENLINKDLCDGGPKNGYTVCGGVGSFGISWTLASYLNYVKEQNSDLLKYFQNPSEYSFAGEETLKRIGEKDYDRLVAQEIDYVMNKDVSGIDEFRALTDIDAAADWWTKNYENCVDCCGNADYDKSCEQIAIRRSSARKNYEEMKGYSCSGSSSSSSSSSSLSSSNSSSSISPSSSDSSDNTCAKLGELRTAMWNKASDSDKASFMKTVSEEDYSIAGVEGYMNQALAYSDGDLSKWLTGQCAAFRGGASCTGSHTITSEEQGWIDKALSGSNNIKFAVGNATGGSNVGAGKIVCVWNLSENKCRDDVDLSAQDGKGACNVYSSSADFGECWGLEMAESWVEEISKSCGSGCGTGEFVWYPQFVEPKYNGKYSNIEVQVKENPMSSDSGTVKTTMGDIGCGPFSFAMMANMIMSREITPDEVTRIAIDTNSIGIHGSYGSVLTKNLAEHYGMEWEKIDNSSNTATIDDITKHLKSGWMIVTGGAGSLPYTSGGHYIGIRGIADDGKWLIADPGHAEEYSQQSWKPEDVVGAGMNIDNVYAFKSTSGTCNNDKDDTNYCNNSSGSGGSSGGGVEGSKPIEPLHEDSTNIKCDPRTKDVGTRDDAYYNYQRYSIRLCALPNVPDTDGNNYGINDGLTHVNSRASGAFYSMAEEYNSKCQSQLTSNEDFRTYAYQEELWYQYGQNPMRVAPPGSSNHEEGLAVDFNNIHSCNDSSISTGSWVNTDFVNKYGLEDSTQGWGDTVEYWHIQAAGSNK